MGYATGISSAISLVAFLLALDTARAVEAPTGFGAADAESISLSLAHPKTADAVLRPPLQLAEVYAEGVDLSRYWVSEKLDGVRAYWDGSRLVSRGGHEIHAPDWFTAGFPSVALDGELWMRRGDFARLSGTVRHQQPDEAEWREVRFMAFDLPASGEPFGSRLTRLRSLVGTSDAPYLFGVDQFRVSDNEALMTHLASLVAAGGEGLMLHREDAFYREGRTSGLLKLKPYLDDEAIVLGQLPGRGKYEGMLGSLLVEDRQGRRFRIGTGFSDAERDDPPPLGSCVTFRYRGHTSSGLPRFASYLRRCDPE